MGANGQQDNFLISDDHRQDNPVGIGKSHRIKPLHRSSEGMKPEPRCIRIVGNCRQGAAQQVDAVRVLFQILP